jgi:thymidylate kinase
MRATEPPRKRTPRQAKAQSTPTCRGQLIVFEGPDGVGKSTLAKMVTLALGKGGHCRLMSFPGREDGTLGQLVYRLHHDAAALGVQTLSETARQALHVAAHLDVMERIILPALASGEHVILDRFWWSTLVYGKAAGIEAGTLKALIEPEVRLWGDQPTILFLVDRDTPIERDEDIVFWQELRRLYAELASEVESAGRIEHIRNTGTLQDAVLRVLARLPDGVRSQVGKGRRGPAEQIAMAFHPRPERPQQVGAPTVFSRLEPAQPTIVFDTYWRFASERQEVFFRRLQGQRRPWTADSIIEEHKFTNAYRASDRVSQYLIRNVIYRDDLPSSPEEVCFRILIYKLFNKVETWELLEKALGAITYEDYNFKRYDSILTKALSRGERIYSAAYIMPPGSRAFGHLAKHQNHLELLESMMCDDVPLRLAGARRMQDAFDLLLSYPTIGDFLAYQFVTDINYSAVTNFSEMEFVMPGPGALDGIRKCFSSLGGLNEPEIIKLVAERQVDEFARLGLQFRTLFGRRLQLIDCQNLFCEVDKYARAAHPEFLGRTGRSRIKQRFSPIAKPITFWYPPKWEINEGVAAFSAHTRKTAAE